MDCDAASLYPSSMDDEKSVHLKVESGFAFKPHMNITYIDAFNDQTFNQDGNESALLRLIFYDPPNLIFQHLTVKEKGKNIKINMMRNRYTIETLTSVDIRENAQNGGKVIEFYESVIYRENCKISAFRKDIEKLFALRQKNRGEHHVLIQGLVKIIMNSLYGAQKN